MDNQEKNSVEEQIRINEEEIARIKEQIEENNRIIKEGERIIRETKREKRAIVKQIWINNIKIAYNTTSFYVAQVLKSPIYILSIVIVLICMLANWFNLRSIVTKLALNQYPKEDTIRIYKRYYEISNHATWVFYILFLLYLTIIK